MKLISDDKQQSYYWVDDFNKKISPTFDYEEDAIQWKTRENAERVTRQSIYWPFPMPPDRF